MWSDYYCDNMRKRQKNIKSFTILFVMLIFSIQIGFVSGNSDEDSDGVPDDIELINRRIFDIEIMSDYIDLSISSTDRSDVDIFHVVIPLMIEGLNITFEYARRKQNSGSNQNWDFQGGLFIKNLIEYNDTNSNQYLD